MKRCINSLLHYFIIRGDHFLFWDFFVCFGVFWVGGGGFLFGFGFFGVFLQQKAQLSAVNVGDKLVFVAIFPHSRAIIGHKSVPPLSPSGNKNKMSLQASKVINHLNKTHVFPNLSYCHLIYIPFHLSSSSTMSCSSS